MGNKLKQKKAQNIQVFWRLNVRHIIFDGTNWDYKFSTPPEGLWSSATANEW